MKTKLLKEKKLKQLSKLLKKELRKYRKAVEEIYNICWNTLK